MDKIKSMMDCKERLWRKLIQKLFLMDFCRRLSTPLVLIFLFIVRVRIVLNLIKPFGATNNIIINAQIKTSPQYTYLFQDLNTLYIHVTLTLYTFAVQPIQNTHM